MSNARVVVTGFGPFGSVVRNSSTVAALNLKDKWEAIQSDDGSPIKLIVLPNIEVSFTSADKVVSEIWDEIKPDLVVHVGIDSTADKIRIETQSTFDFCEHSDGEDFFHRESYCKTICTNLKLEDVCVQLNSLGFNCCLSDDPGCYVCGYTYYRSLERNPCRSVFIHVPKISDTFTANYLGDFLLSLIIILCKQCNISVSAALEDYFGKKMTTG